MYLFPSYFQDNIEHRRRLRNKIFGAMSKRYKAIVNHVNPMVPRAFFKQKSLHFLDIFSLDVGQVSSNLIKMACMPSFPLASLFITFLHGHAQKSKFCEKCEFFFSFSPFIFLLFIIFLLQLLTFFWACFQFTSFRESTIDTENSYHGVAKCSGGKFCSEIFHSNF